MPFYRFQVDYACRYRKGVMLNGPFFTTQRTTLIEYLIIVLER